MTTIFIEQQLAYRSFPDFLKWCKIESDNPDNPGVIDWEPWDYLMGLAEQWGDGNSQVILKARQLGISWLLAGFGHWRSCYHPTSHGALISKGQRESVDLIRRMKFIHDHLPQWLQDPAARWLTEQVTYSSGSIVRANPSTPDAGLGMQNAWLGMDEYAFHEYGGQNYSALVPTVSAGGQLLIFSTASHLLGPNGPFYERWVEARDGLTPYEPIFLPWDIRPNRDGDWLRREREKFVGLPQDFAAMYPSTAEEAFQAKSGLVYEKWDDKLHVRAPSIPWEACVRRVVGVDFGGGDPTAIVMMGYTKDGHVHQYGEFYERGAIGTDDIAHYIAQWDNRARVSSIECDPSQGTAIETLRALGLPAQPANNRKTQGITEIAMLIDLGRLTISPECVNSIKEFAGYRWRETNDPNSKERYTTSTPVDHHADAHDARRYAVRAIWGMMTTGPVIRQLGKGKRATSAV